jgi:wyosine [tRNA(Phe)-imidazoG37] synthetase (radical SAM superfamily)
VKKVASKPSRSAVRKPAKPLARAAASTVAKARPAPKAAPAAKRAAQAKPVSKNSGKAVPAAKAGPTRPSPASRPSRPAAAPPRVAPLVASKPPVTASRLPVAASKSPAAQPRASAGAMLMPLHEGIVYGPVRSRRLGRSLGINLTPAHLKLCSFNCSYCQYGWSEHSRRASEPGFEHWPSAATVAKAVAVALRSIAAQNDRVDRLTLAGHGEPTMHPKFREVVAALKKVRDELAPGVPIAVLSNASTLERADVCAALAELDERYMKLDAGDTATLRSVNGSPLSIEQLVGGLKKVPDIVIQAMFVKDRTGRVDNTGDLTVINWVGALDRIRPKAVQIYTIDRTPAFPYLQPVAPARLREIVQRVRLAGFPCDVFGIPDPPPEPRKA